MILEWMILLLTLSLSVRFGQYLAMTKMTLWQLCLLMLSIKFMVYTYAN
jgi:hypothetical protein